MLFKILTALTILVSIFIVAPFSMARENDPITGRQDRSREMLNLRERIEQLEMDIDQVNADLDQAGFEMVTYKKGLEFAQQHLGFKEKTTSYYLQSNAPKGLKLIKTLDSLETEVAIDGFFLDLESKLESSVELVNELKIFKKKLEGHLKLANEQFNSIVR